MATLRRMRCWLALLALLLVMGAAADAVRAETGPVSAVHVLTADDRIYRAAAEAGFATVVQVFPWRDIEPTADEWHWEQTDFAVRAAGYYGLSLIVRLDHPPDWALISGEEDGSPPFDLDAYAQFVTKVAQRYRGQVLGYIVWNEPNLSCEWGGHHPAPAAYQALLCRAYAALKAGDPGALVVSAGLAPTNGDGNEAMDDRIFLREMYETGAGVCFDVLGVHAYGFGYPPYDPRGAHHGLNLNRTLDLREIMVAQDDGAKPVWITEMGWTTDGMEAHSWQTVSPEQQADYLTHAWQHIERRWPWIKVITVWNLSRALPDADEMAGYSLLEGDGSPKPAYHALADLFTEDGDGKPGNRLDCGTGSEPQTTESEISILAADEVVHLGDNQ